MDTVSFIVIKDGQPVVVSKQVQYSDEFLNMLKDENESVYFDELDESEQKKLFRQFDVSVVVPLKIKNKRVGFMILSKSYRAIFIPQKIFYCSKHLHRIWPLQLIACSMQSKSIST